MSKGNATAFDAITKDKPTLAGFLRSLPCIEAPWDTAFQKRYCSSCTAENRQGRQKCRPFVIFGSWRKEECTNT